MRPATTLITAVALIFPGAGAFVGGSHSGSIQPEKDSQITTTVKAELAADRATQDTPIGVTTENGVVALSGVVSSAATKQKAEREARNVQGVVAVRNELMVRP